MLNYMLIIVMTFMGATASFFFKRASASNGFKQLILNRFIYIGGIIYIISAGVNILVLRYLDYSIVLPLTSFTYIWTMVFSYFFLKEKININKVAGVGLIIVGAILITM